MTQVGLFKMERRFNLSIDAGVEGLRNLPMYNTYKIDIYKGIDNRFELSIRNNDRKSVSVKEDATVVFSLVSEDKSKKYDYTATPTQPALGLYEVVIPEFDLRSIEVGSYFGHIIVKQDDIEEPLYTTQDFYPFADVVVHENKFNTTGQAVEISGDSFTREVIQDEITGKYYEIFTSEPIKASKATTHSILAELVEFVGDVIIEQCLREDPDPESWSELLKRAYEVGENGEKFNGLDIFVFSAVTEYVRVKWKRERGSDANLLNIVYRPETMTGGAVASVNGKVGDVVLTGEDIKIVAGEGMATITEALEANNTNIANTHVIIAGINELIPEAASKENLLVDKAEMDATLKNELADKAGDDVVVHRTGVDSETIDGDKVFAGTSISRSSAISAENPNELITAGYLETSHNKSATAHSDIRGSITTLQGSVSKIEAIEGNITTINDTLTSIAGNTLFSTTPQKVTDVPADAELADLITAFNGLLAELRTRGIIG